MWFGSIQRRIRGLIERTSLVVAIDLLLLRLTTEDYYISGKFPPEIS
jgi:hypothetical protein